MEPATRGANLSTPPASRTSRLEPDPERHPLVVPALYPALLPWIVCGQVPDRVRSGWGCCTSRRHLICGAEGTAGRMSTMPKSHPKEFRDDVVAVAFKGEAPIAEVARCFGVSESCLRNLLIKAAVQTIEDPAGPRTTRRSCEGEAAQSPARAEDETFWRGFPLSLKQRGLAGCSSSSPISTRAGRGVEAALLRFGPPAVPGSLRPQPARPCPQVPR